MRGIRRRTIKLILIEILLLILCLIDSELIIYYLYRVINDPGPYVSAVYVLVGILFVTNILKKNSLVKKEIIENVRKIYGYIYGYETLYTFDRKIRNILKIIIIILLILWETIYLVFATNIVPLSLKSHNTNLIICVIFRFILGFLIWILPAFSLIDLLTEYILFRLSIRKFLGDLDKCTNVSILTFIFNTLNISFNKCSDIIDKLIEIHSKLRIEMLPLRLLSIYSLIVSLLSLTYPFVILYIKCLIFRIGFKITMIFTPWAFVPSIIICIISIVVVTMANILLNSVKDFGYLLSFLCHYSLLNDSSKSNISPSFSFCMNYILNKMYGRNVSEVFKLILSVLLTVLSILLQIFKFLIYIV